MTKHCPRLNQAFIDTLHIGEIFTYEKPVFDRSVLYCVGLKVSTQFMIPLGLPCATLNNARKAAEKQIMIGER